MTVKQLHEILGKYIDVGAGDWIVMFSQTQQFKTRKEHRDWVKSKQPSQSFLSFVADQVLFANEAELSKYYCVLLPALIIKDENKPFYTLPSEDYVKESIKAKSAKTTKRTKKSKTTKGSKKK